MINVYITDDHPIVLDGLKTLIESRSDMQLKGLFTSAADTSKALAEEMVDVLLLDINLPDKSGIDLSGELKERYHELAIIMLSVHNERAVVGSALKNKVNGYLLKNSAGDEIIEAIHAVWEGNSYLCKQTRDILYQSDSGLQAIPVITRREKEVLGLIALGYTTSEIGEKLFVSSHTVESHRKNLMEKFNAKSMPAIIKLATAYKLI